jgi:long-chain fatty acid transport protein
MWRANERTILYGSVRERYWSSLEEIRVEFANPLQPDAVDVVNYKDARRYSAGVDFEVSDQWVVRAGVALDETPTDSANRLARIADNTRRYYALGASWIGSQNWQIDIGYNWIDIDESEFDRVGDFGERLRGRFEGGANVLSIGATYKFGSKNARGVRG